ncbi:MAG: CopD family protein [Saprospiraceae bacterium]|nr:CopD family protein [Saprospiraceae bacterium]
MSLAYLVSVFLHVILAAFWIGGMLFLPLIILPGIKHHPDRIALLYRTGLRFRFYGWIALFGLFLTGLTNFLFRGIPLTWTFFSGSDYGKLVMYKSLIFLVILLVSGVHDFFLGKKALETLQNSPNHQLRQLARWSGRINLLLALLMAFLGVVLSRGGVLVY